MDRTQPDRRGDPPANDEDGHMLGFIIGVIIWGTVLLLGWYVLTELRVIANALERLEQRLAAAEDGIDARGDGGPTRR